MTKEQGQRSSRYEREGGVCEGIVGSVSYTEEVGVCVRVYMLKFVVDLISFGI